MSSENTENEQSFICKSRRWRWSFWLAVGVLAILWFFAAYEVIGYLLRG